MASGFKARVNEMPAKRNVNLGEFILILCPIRILETERFQALTEQEHRVFVLGSSRGVVNNSFKCCIQEGVGPKDLHTSHWPGPGGSVRKELQFGLSLG